jgi:hypothetical protein
MAYNQLLRNGHRFMTNISVVIIRRSRVNTFFIVTIEPYLSAVSGREYAAPANGMTWVAIHYHTNNEQAHVLCLIFLGVENFLEWFGRFIFIFLIISYVSFFHRFILVFYSFSYFFFIFLLKHLNILKSLFFEYDIF